MQSVKNITSDLRERMNIFIKTMNRFIKTIEEIKGKVKEFNDTKVKEFNDNLDYIIITLKTQNRDTFTKLENINKQWDNILRNRDNKDIDLLNKFIIRQYYTTRRTITLCRNNTATTYTW